MAKREGFTFYVIEASPKGYGEDDVRYYCTGKGYDWKNSPHEATHYSMRSWVDKRVKELASGCNWIRVLTYTAKLETAEDIEKSTTQG